LLHGFFHSYGFKIMVDWQFTYSNAITARKQIILFVYLNMPPLLKNILLVDDDSDDCQMLEEAILHHDENVRIHKATTAAELMEYLERCGTHEMPRLIIMDYNLPDKNGAQVLEWIQSAKPYSEIPVVIWSTSNLGQYQQVCLQKGARDYFVKPFNHAELAEQTSKMLNYYRTNTG